jgi:hypothetical protein
MICSSVSPNTNDNASYQPGRERTRKSSETHEPDRHCAVTNAQDSTSSSLIAAKKLRLKALCRRGNSTCRRELSIWSGMKLRLAGGRSSSDEPVRVFRNIHPVTISDGTSGFQTSRGHGWRLVSSPKMAEVKRCLCLGSVCLFGYQ